MTNEWLSGTWTLDAVLRRIAADGLGPGLEVVGFQSFRDFPRVSASDVTAFRDAVDDLALQPSALGGYVDAALRPGRVLDVDQAERYLQPQLDAATRLGFPLVRAALGLDPVLLERLVPTLESLGVTLVLEVQGPTTMDSPALVSTVELFEKLRTPALGLVLDFSLSMVGLPVTLLRRLRADGLSAGSEAVLVEAWRARRGPGEFFARCPDAPPAALAPFVRFGSSAPEEFAPLLPWVRHVHAKFWDLEDADEHVAGPHAAFLRMLTDAGYDGPISSEWGGSEWLESTDVDGFEITRRHLGLVRALLKE